MPRKVYVGVVARHEINGEIIPLSIKYEDGEEYEIDRVLDICRAASIKVGGVGLRYHCRIRGRETYIWHESGEGNKWFVEGKD